MHPVAIEKARSRLRVARRALDDLKACQDMETFHDAWYSFLTSAKNIYSILKLGADTSSPQSRQWYGAKARERRGDPLLQYIYEARNADEHGLGRSTKEVSGSIAIGRTAPGYSSAVKVSGSLDRGGSSLQVTALDNKPVLVEATPRHIALVPVTARGPRVYPPPEIHLGKKLTSNKPIPVAELTLAYLEALIEEAASLA
jgi:hypothetical protein